MRSSYPGGTSGVGGTAHLPNLPESLSQTFRNIDAMITYRKPFSAIAEGHQTGNWLGVAHEIRTFAVAAGAGGLAKTR